MTRNWHYLRSSAEVGWPKSQCVLALSLRRETPRETSAARVAVALDSWSAIAWRDGPHGPTQEIASSGRDIASFWRMLAVVMRRGERLWLWCRGMAHALSVMGGWTLISGKAPTLCIVSDPPTIIDATIGGITGSVRFLDLRNVGIDACECVEHPELQASNLRIQLLAYQQLARDLDLGGLRCTVAAQSWHGWKYRYLGCPVEVHNDVRRLNAEKMACFGGRCEVLRCGLQSGPLYEVDAQAQYPSCASDSPLPARTCRTTDIVGLSAEQTAAQGMLVIARGRVYTDTPCVPCARDGLIVYPVGSWPATYCWPEIELVRSEGGRFDVKEFWAYEACDCVSHFMRTLWMVRRRARSIQSWGRESASKLLANSIIGRIGALGHAWAHMPEEFHPEPWGSWWGRHPDDGVMARWRTIAGRVEVETVAGWGDESIPAVSAWVYSLARVRLHKWMRIAGLENVVYCDTDSLWTNAVGLRRIEEAKELRPGTMGGLRVKAVHAWARLYGSKHYDSPAGVKWAGVPRNSVSASEDRWAYTYSESPGRAAHNGRAPVSELLVATVPDGRTYRGGMVGAGGVVYPWSVYEDEQV